MREAKKPMNGEDDLRERLAELEKRPKMIAAAHAAPLVFAPDSFRGFTPALSSYS